MKVAILTVSTRCARDEREDLSGARLAELTAHAGWEVAQRDVIPDDLLTIVRRLIQYADEHGVELVLTTGGTGPAPTDVTPEATRMVIEKPFPGIAETLRRHSESKSKYAALSRGEAGSRGRTLIVNFPGSPNAAAEYWEVLEPLAGHTCRLLAGTDDPHE